MKIQFTRTIDVIKEVDVCVIGGGPAGCAAAYSAAMVKGIKVLLVEGTGSLGGMGTLGGVPAFTQFGDGKKFLAKGFGWTLLKNLEEAGGTYPETISNEAGQNMGIRSEVLKRVYDQMLLDSGVDISLCTQLIDVETDGRKVCHAICAAKSGIFAIKAKRFVDCTGDGDLCVWAGAAFEKGDKDDNLMPGTLCSLFTGIDFDTVSKSGLNPRVEILKAIDDGVFSLPDLHLPGIWQLGEHIGGGNISHAFGLDGTDEKSLTHHYIDSRKRMVEYVRFYKEYLKGYENMQLIATGALMGVRETRRIICDMTMTLEHFKNRASFDDEIGRYSYPIDIHISKPDAEQYKAFEKDFHENFRYAQGESYGISYRSLIPRDLDNVLVAGRCIGSDRYFNGSVRVMAGCYITGQAAGKAEAVSIKKNIEVRKIKTAELQLDQKH